MKEMTYGTKRTIEILGGGTYKCHLYAILSLGTHPTAYVEDKLGARGYEDEMLDDVKVHGGFTFCGYSHWEGSSVKYLGWDYAHYEDYAGYEELFPEDMRRGGKKWTTEEIMEEVKSAIDQLIVLEERG